MSAHFDTIVIGGGHNGLVAAAYLAKGGQRVLVLEGRDVVGGAAATEEIFPGYRVDTGAHRIGGFSSRIVSDLGLAGRFELLPADPTTFAPVEEGPPLTLWADPVRTAEEIRAHSTADADAWPAFVKLVSDAAGFLESAWHATPPDITGTDVRDLWASASLGHRLRRLGKRQMVEVMRILPMSMYELLEEWFESDVLRGTLAASAVQGLCQGPMGGGTVYLFLHHHVGAPAGVIRPTVRVRGGVGRISEVLTTRCRELGAEVRTGAVVDRIVVEDGSARGVVLADGSEIRATRIASSLDPQTTLFGLLDPAYLDPAVARKVENIRYRGVTAKVHFALSGLPDFACRPGSGSHLEGAISIGPSLEYVERAYDAVKYGAVSAEPCLELSIPSLVDPDVAPEGRHLASVVMQYAPYALREGAWDEAARKALGDLVARTITRYAPNFESLIVDRMVLTPADLESRFGLTEGNVYHGEMTLDQLLFMRPIPGASRYQAPIEGLWLCGSGAHPGGGVTGVPGANAAREMLRGR